MENMNFVMKKHSEWTTNWKKEPAATRFQFQFQFQLEIIVIEAHNVALLEMQMHESASVIAMQTANYL